MSLFDVIEIIFNKANNQLKLKMSFSSEIETPGRQLGQFVDQEVNRTEQVIIDRVLALSLEEQSSKPLKSCNSLSAKYRALIINMKMTKSSQKCTVCYTQFCQGEIIKRFPCKHIFHRECAKSWLRVDRKCPNCRLDLEAHFEKLEAQNIEMVAEKNRKQCPKQNKFKQTEH